MATLVAASSSGRGLATTSLTVSHTVPAGSDRFLVVLCDVSIGTTLSATYGGVALTKTSDTGAANGLRLVVLELANPTVGTANVVLTGSASGTICASVLTLTGCVSIGALTTATGTGTAPSVTLSGVDGLALDIVASGVAGQTFTVGPGQTSILEQDSLSGAAGRIATSWETGAASVTMSWSTGGSGPWHIGALIAYGAPAPGRVTQAVIEILGASAPPPAPLTRVTQALVELLGASAPIATRVTTLSVELFTPRTTEARATQLAVEVFSPILVTARTTQAAVEVFRTAPGLAYNTQNVVELFLVFPPCILGAFPVDDVPASVACDDTLPVDTVAVGGSCPVGLLP